MFIDVQAPIGETTGLMTCEAGAFACVLGRSGIARAKYEGDGATPMGLFPIRRVLFRPDREARPATRLGVGRIAPDDGWCDDPASRVYNRPVRLPFAESHERLWRDDRLYDLLVVLGYNDAPAVPGAGSAIFLHVAAPDGRPTEGCVALEAEHLRRVLAGCGPESMLRIRPV